MNATREQQNREAIRRLGMLQKKGMHENVLADFKEGRVSVSERVCFGPNAPACGILYWLDEQPYAPIAKAFEQEHGALVYHATLERTEMGTMLDLFYIDGDDESWGEDRADIRDGYAFAYVANLDHPAFSEFGSIAFAVSGGGLIRL